MCTVAAGNSGLGVPGAHPHLSQRSASVPPVQTCAQPCICEGDECAVSCECVPVHVWVPLGCLCARRRMCVCAGEKGGSVWHSPAASIAWFLPQLSQWTQARWHSKLWCLSAPCDPRLCVFIVMFVCNFIVRSMAKAKKKTGGKEFRVNGDGKEFCSGAQWRGEFAQTGQAPLVDRDRLCSDIKQASSRIFHNMQILEQKDCISTASGEG